MLILDEPTDGLDPNQKHEVRQLIRRMSERKTIIFSTHILEEVEAACTRALIIDGGHIVANGTPEELKLRSDRAGAVLLTVASGEAEAVRNAIAGVPGVGRVETVEQDAHRTALAQSRWGLAGVTAEEGRLDDVFRAITHSDVTRLEGAIA